MLKNANRFARGSGCYKCGCCGRMTRATGRGDNENNGLCAECYDLAGIDNEITDGYVTFEGVREEYVGLLKAIRAKGGKTESFDYDKEES